MSFLVWFRWKAWLLDPPGGVERASGSRNGSEARPVGVGWPRGGACAAGGAEGHEAPQKRGGASQVGSERLSSVQKWSWYGCVWHINGPGNISSRDFHSLCERMPDRCSFTAPLGTPGDHWGHFPSCRCGVKNKQEVASLSFSCRTSLQNSPNTVSLNAKREETQYLDEPKWS